MGVSGLLGLLKSIQKPVHLRQFAGQTIGIDAYGWLHRGTVANAVDLALGKPSTKHIDFAMHRVRMLVHFGAIPYVVFDGDNLPSKAGTEESRAQRRKDSKKAGLELLRLGKSSQAQQELQKAVDVTPEMARQLIEELKHHGIKYVVAPYEADAQLVYLEKKGHINAIISEDSDMLVFGAKCLLTKLDQYGECVMIRQEDFTACREVNLAGWTIAEFRLMAILSGCDYLQGIPRMGLKTAHKLVRKYKTVDRIVRAAAIECKIRVPPGYLDSFAQAEATFLYQWVFCPEARLLVNFTQPEQDNLLDGITYIGKYIAPDVAQLVASGEINPMTKEPIRTTYKPKQYRRSLPENTTPSTSKVDQASSNKEKSIDTFFRPRRVPLQELDPNSFTPSPSQQRLLERHHGQVTSEIIRQQSLSAPARSNHILQSSSNSRIPIPTLTNPFKRQRLCADENSSPSKPVGAVAGTCSKFFLPTAKTTDHTVPLPGSKKKNLPDINLWSDDSIDFAMAKLPDSGAEAVREKSKKARIDVFKDEEIVTPRTLGSDPDRPTTNKNRNNLSNITTPTPFSKFLLDETKDLRERSRRGMLASAGVNGHYRTGTRESQTRENDAGSAKDTLPVSSPHESPTKDPDTPPPLTPQVATPPAHIQVHTLLACSPPIKGSEDLLLIPDSDADSDSQTIVGDEEADSGTTRIIQASPIIGQQTSDLHKDVHGLHQNQDSQQDKSTNEQTDDENENRVEAEDENEHNVIRKLNLRRFSYDAPMART